MTEQEKIDEYAKFIRQLATLLSKPTIRYFLSEDETSGIMHILTELQKNGDDKKE